MNFESVYKLVQKIPQGKVTTYGEIARALRISPRVVGYALHMNPDPKKTPCHRVVSRIGKLAPSYAFGGEGKQREKLEKEGVIFDRSFADLKKCFFRVDTDFV